MNSDQRRLLRVFAFGEYHCGRNGASREQLLERMRAAAPDVIVSSGDLAHHGGEDEQLFSAIDEIGRPFLFTYGNHDIRRDCHERVAASANLGETIYSIGDVAFIGAAAWNPSMTFEKPADFGTEIFRLNGRVAELPPTAVRILVVHGAPRMVEELPPDYTGVLDEECEDFVLAMIERQRPQVAIIGHRRGRLPDRYEVCGTKCIDPGPAGLLLEIPMGRAIGMSRVVAGS